MNIIDIGMTKAILGVQSRVDGPPYGHRFGSRQRSLIRLAAALMLATILTGFYGLPTALAQEEVLIIKNMDVRVWPEYDNQLVLVVYEGEFLDGSVFPQDVKFLAPLNAEIGQVCALRKPSNEHWCQLAQTEAEEGSLAILYELPIPTYFLEYYYDGIEGGTDRGFAFEFQSPYSIQNLEIEVQQPLRSSNFSLSPEGAVKMSAGDGFKYYRYAFDDVEPGQALTIDASYSKSDTRPSVSGASGGGGISAVAVIVVLALAALAVTGWFLMRRHQRTSLRPVHATHSARKPRMTSPTPSATQATAKGAKSAFCSQCGTPLEKDDKFCSDCGAKGKGAD